MPDQLTHLPLTIILNRWLPGRRQTWDDEEHDIRSRECACCGQDGHYQQRLEAHIAAHGIPGGVCLGDNGRVWDGHHRIIAARRLRIAEVPVEVDDA